jgi:hypothetical protein
MIAIYLIVLYFAVASIAAIFIYIPYLIAGRIMKSFHIGDFIMSCAVWTTLVVIFVCLSAAALMCASVDACMSLFKPNYWRNSSNEQQRLP